jgi:hypothetical protein
MTTVDTTHTNYYISLYSGAGIEICGTIFVNKLLGVKGLDLH